MTGGGNGRGPDEHDDRIAPIAIVATATLLDEMLAALAHRRRRHVLYRLRERGTTDLDDLARHVAAAEADVPAADVDDETRADVETTLTHSHLPRLDDAALVDYDPRTGAIRYGYPPPVLEALLGICADVEAPETTD